jgi:hypothetical protein
MAVVWPFLSVTFFATLALPWAWFPNERVVGEMVTFCENDCKASKTRQAGAQFLQKGSTNLTGILGERN